VLKQGDGSSSVIDTTHWCVMCCSNGSARGERDCVHLPRNVTWAALLA